MTPEHRPAGGGVTPGPWHYYLDSEGYYAIGHDSDAHEPGDIAHVYIPGAVDPEYDDGNEGLANARLMTAAPALLAALEKAQAVEDHELECLFCLHADPCGIRGPMAADANVARVDALSAARAPSDDDAASPGRGEG